MWYMDSPTNLTIDIYSYAQLTSIVSNMIVHIETYGHEN
jgi:hypothetical protein